MKTLKVKALMLHCLKLCIHRSFTGHTGSVEIHSQKCMKPFWSVSVTDGIRIHFKMILFAFKPLKGSCPTIPHWAPAPLDTQPVSQVSWPAASWGRSSEGTKCVLLQLQDCGTSCHCSLATYFPWLFTPHGLFIWCALGWTVYYVFMRFMLI